MICNHAVTQIWRTWSRNLVTPPKDFLIGRVNNIHSLGALWTCVKLIWSQKQFHGIFLIFFMEWRMASSSCGASFIPCFSWGIDWLSLFQRLTSAYGRDDFRSWSRRIPAPIQADFFFPIEDFCIFFLFLYVLASVLYDLNGLTIFFSLYVCFLFGGNKSNFCVFI